MATLQMRDYGALGGNGSQGAAGDGSTWNKAVADAKAGDTIHIAYQAGQAIIKSPSGAQNRKSGVDFAIDEGIELWPQVGGNETWTMGGLSNCEFGQGNVNGVNGTSKHPLSKAGKWGVQLNARKNPAVSGEVMISRIQNCASVAFRWMWIESMCETTAAGQGTAFCSSSPCFNYSAPTGQGSAPQNITLDHVVALNCTYGYGLCQLAACINPTFIAIAGEGGTVLRPEQQSGTWMRIENLQAHGVYAARGNCGFQMNPHTEHQGALGCSYTVTDLTVEEMARVYLLVPENLSSGSIDGIAAIPGPNAQIAVSSIPGVADPNKSTDGRTTQAWKRGTGTEFASSRAGSIVENATNQVKNVVYFGNFPGGRGIPTGADVRHATSEADLKSDPQWLAGFGAQRVNAEDPTTAFVSPPAGTVTTQTITLVVSASDPDGLRSVEFRVNTGPWITMNTSGTPGQYSAPVSLIAGSNLVEMRATDAGNPARVAAIKQRTYNWSGNTTNAGPPTVSWVSPTAAQNSRSVTATVTASDTDGIAAVRMSIDDGATWVAATKGTGTNYSAALTLPGTAGQSVTTNVLVEATDGHAAPLSRQITHAVTVNLPTTINTGPVITFLGPADNLTSASQIIRVRVTDTDGVDPASVELRVGTSSTWTRMQATATANEYQLAVVLPGTGGTQTVAVEVRATDRHPTNPQQSFQQHTYTLTLTTGAIYIDHTAVVVRVTATDPDGIAFIGVSVNGGATVPMTKVAGTPNDYSARTTLSGKNGQSVTNQVVVTVTDAHPSDPQTTRATATVVVTLPFDDGGTGTPGSVVVLPAEPERAVGVRWRVGVFARDGTLVRLLTEVIDPQWTIILNGIDTFKFSLRIDDPLAYDLIPRAVSIKLWRFIPGRPVVQSRPDFAGLLGPINETEQTVTFNASSPLWDLKKRFVWTALDWTGPRKKDQSEMMWALINYTQTRVANATCFIERGNLPVTVDRERQYAVAQNIYSALFDLTEQGTEGGVIGGMDIDPEYVNDGTATLMRFNTQPKLGQLRQEARIDYFTGRRNASGMQRDYAIDEATIGNLVRVDGQGEDGQTVIPAFDFDSDSITGLGLLERWEREDNLQTFAALKAEATEILKTSKEPTIVVRPTLSQGLDPVYGRDFAVGDLLPCSAKRGRMQFFNEPLRCFQADLTQQASGFESVSLTLAKDLD